MPIADQSEVKTIVKLRLQLTDATHDALIDSYIREIGRRIQHFCNITEITDMLTDTWASMVMDALRIEMPSVDEINETAGGADNIKVGDTSVAPVSASSGLSNTTKTVIDQIVLNYRTDLVRYRKLRW
ncbi:DNA-packaging protein [Paenibacillus puldeungensis]|uniref:DNA-packaging protein n=1 Tax=Paenibacillus puldeungensis TaxID=696536 RepID=A0ABW3S341_9BACL